MLEVAVQREDGWDAAIDWDALATAAVREALTVSPHGDLLTAPFAVEVSVRLTSDADVQKLNAAYRHKDAPTNVLSFPMVQADLLGGLADVEDGEILLGDIVLALETCTREAADKGLSVANHAAHLIVHGTLHLVGYEHEDEAEGDAMEALEVKALATLGIADPYATHDS